MSSLSDNCTRNLVVALSALLASAIAGLAEAEICPGNRSDLCLNPECRAGVVLEACFCEDGYGAQEVGSWSSGSGEYTCCPGQDNFECGDFSIANIRLLQMGAVFALALGVAGMLVVYLLSSMTCGRPAAALATADDLLVVDAPTHRDGRRLHQEVPMDLWCVTREDLRQFRRLVLHAVRQGRIVPTELDRFDPADSEIGPCVHTVNAQFIMPVTQRAGGMSWALMLHPSGLPCDLFVTHGWAEGIYEFIDKVLHSWPMGAKHAYCCMLSNPQNLDISAFINCPLDSPFARALRSAKYLLAVPNRRESIYTRIWCTYEVFLAYSWRKLIWTASPPVPGLLPQVFRVISVFVLGWSFSILIVLELLLRPGHTYIGDMLVIPCVISFGLLWLLWLPLQRDPSSVAAKIVVRLVPISLCWP